MAANNNDVIRAACVWKLNGADEIVNVFHLQVFDAASLIEDANLNLGVAAWFERAYFTSNVVGSVSNEVLHDRIEMYNVTLDAPLLDVGRIPELDGDSTGERLPEGVAGLVIARTAKKRRVGRKFLPVFTEGASSSGQWASGVLTTMAAFGDYWRTDFVTEEDFSLRGVVGGEGTPLWSPIIQTLARTLPAYQRRRRIGRGS